MDGADCFLRAGVIPDCHQDGFRGFIVRVDGNNGRDARYFENVVDFRNGVNDRYSSRAAWDREGLFIVRC